MKRKWLPILILIFVHTGSAINLSEANLIDVESREDRFSVTMIHDDSGEEGYANWWQVETLEGEKLGRRELLHGHGTRNFTRSKTIPVDAEKVVVRAHDQNHGYGGQAIIYDLETGNKEIIQQGEERKKFDNYTGNEVHQNKRENRTEEDTDTSVEDNSLEDEGEKDENGIIGEILRFLREIF